MSKNNTPLLRCDKCEGIVKIIDSRLIEDSTTMWRTRRYKCSECGYKFETLEKLKGVHRSAKLDKS